jgi:hypothetical protein
VTAEKKNNFNVKRRQFQHFLAGMVTEWDKNNLIDCQAEGINPLSTQSVDNASPTVEVIKRKNCRDPSKYDILLNNSTSNK